MVNNALNVSGSISFTAAHQQKPSDGAKEPETKLQNYFSGEQTLR